VGAAQAAAAAVAAVPIAGSTFALMESIRLDLGYPGASTIHP
jgi:hypothetical protein